MVDKGSRTALVTGASSGIGSAVTRSLSASGLHVIGLGRNRDSLEALAAATGAETRVCDVTKREEVAEVLAGRNIDVLVNNAGVLTSRAPFFELEPAAIDEMIEVNLRAVLQLTRLVVPQMIDRRSGHIVFVGSSAGLYPHPTASVYGATKAAVHLFSDALRCDLLGHSIGVTEVVPGRVETNLYRDAMGASQAQRELYDGYEALQPDDIAAAILSALTMPARAVVSRIEVFPNSQAVGGSRFIGREEGA